MKLSALDINPENPRLIKDEAFQKLINSIRDFPEMMKLRPIVVVPVEGKKGKYTILGGTMRYRALQALEYDVIPDDWVKVATGLTEDQIKEFIVKDNVAAGDWDTDILIGVYGDYDLDAWGIDISQLEGYEGIKEPEEEPKQERSLSGEDIGGGGKEETFILKVICKSEDELTELFNRLIQENYECELE